MTEQKTTIQKAETVQLNYFDIEQMNNVQRIAKIFTSSVLVPKIYQIKEVGENQAIANCIIALDMSTRLGANPLMVMQNLNIIQGRPSWSSKFLISTINTCGRFEPLKFKFNELGKIKNVKYTSYKWENGRNIPVQNTFTDEVLNVECIAYTKDLKSGQLLESSPVTVEMSIKEGWYTKNGSKWPTMANQMLMYRAASFWANSYAPEISMGMKTEEEINDIIDISHVQEPEQNNSPLDSFKLSTDENTIQPDPKTQKETEPLNSLFKAG